MKTRIVKTNMWRDSLIYPMNIDTKLIYLYLLTNERAGLTDFQAIIPAEISLYTGIDESLIELCINQLKDRCLLLYYKGWIRMTNGSYVSSNYRGGNVDKAKLEEISSIPADVRDFLGGNSELEYDELDDTQVPDQVPDQVPLNNKSKIINNKSKKEKINYFEKFKEDKELIEWCNSYSEAINKRCIKSIELHEELKKMTDWVDSKKKAHSNPLRFAKNWLQKKLDNLPVSISLSTSQPTYSPNLQEINPDYEPPQTYRRGGMQSISNLLNY